MVWLMLDGKFLGANVLIVVFKIMKNIRIHD